MSQTTRSPAAPASGQRKPNPIGVAGFVIERVAPFLAAVLLAFVALAAIIAILGHDPFQAFRALLTTSFRTPYGFFQTLQKWIPLTLMALAFTTPLAAGRFNIGGEGQLLLGATGAVAVGITFSNLPILLLLPAVLIAGGIAGGLWAGIAAWLMGRFRVNEILSTVLLNFVAFGILEYAAADLWPDPGAGFPSTLPVGEGARLPLIGSSTVHSGVVLAALVALAVAVGIRKSVAGYELRAVGINQRAARVHGVRAGRVVVGAMILGGMIGGLTGAIEVAGVHGKMLEGMQSNYMVLGIIIGLIARGSAVAVPFVGFGIAVLEIGASAMQRTAQVPVEIILIVEALILFFLLLSDMVAVRLRSRR